MRYLIFAVVLLASCNTNTNEQNQDKANTMEINTDIIKPDTISSNEVKFEYQNYYISPIINNIIEKDKNLIYCSSFGISWNKIKDEILNSPIQLNKNISWIDYLNKQSKNNSISPKYISAIVGIGKDDILTKIKSDLKTRFNYDYSPKYVVNKTDILSVAYLKKEIMFYSELEESSEDEKLLFNDSINVDFFSVKFPINKNEFRTHDFINKDDFIFQIVTKSEKDEIYFAKIIPELTLVETYQKVMKRIKKNKVKLLGFYDQVRIPYIKFKIENEFKELEGVKVLNKGFESYSISRAVQIINFDLNKTGITLESIAELSFSDCKYDKDPRILMFDKPFLIILKEKNKEEPYFLMWVNNTEFMNKKE